MVLIGSKVTSTGAEEDISVASKYSVLTFFHLDILWFQLNYLSDISGSRNLCSQVLFMTSNMHAKCPEKLKNLKKQ